MEIFNPRSGQRLEMKADGEKKRAARGQCTTMPRRVFAQQISIARRQVLA